jgi:transglutaminase-like putative cysteine protease
VTRTGRACLLAVAASALSAADWKPVEPEELSRKIPVVEKDADAEAIFWDVRVGNEQGYVGGPQYLVLSHYIRVKVFNNRGRNRLSTVDIPIQPGTNITGIAGRTIRPDGSILDLAKEAVFERVLDKTGDVRVKHKSFTMPGVEPGCIIEYQWREERTNQWLNYLPLDFQRGIPIRVVRYWIKPNTVSDSQMMIQDFQCHRTPPERDKRGYYMTAMSDVPAFKEEPYMPPAGELKAWALVYHKRTSDISAPDRFWIDHGKATYNRYEAMITASKGVRRRAAEITAAAKTEEEKLLALVDFCKRGIKDSFTEEASAAERAKMEKKTGTTPDDTLKQGIGSPADITFLFAALANAAGFDARIAEVPDRNEVFFERRFPDAYFLKHLVVAVRVQGAWRFFDSTLFVPRSGLPWFHEGVEALVSDLKEPIFVTTPLSPPEKTVTRRQGNFRLTDDGTLEGDVVLEFGGHEAEVRKWQIQHESVAHLEEGLKTMLERHASTSEFSDIKIENASDPEKPLIYRCHLRAPGYAQRTGKRLFFAPSFFGQGGASRFPSKERRYPVYFHYGWVDEDQITIELPAGFRLEEPRVPNPIPMGQAGGYEAHARIVNKTQLVFERRFVIGRNGNLLLPVALYPALKEAFDKIALADSQTMALKQVSADGSN